MTDQQAGNKRRANDAAALWKKRRAEIERLYLTEGWSQARLADRYGVTQAAFQKVIVRLGIPSRGRGRRGSENGRFIHGMSSTLYRELIPKTACAECGATTDLCIHHKDDDHLNNEIGNLMVLCMPCHSRHHRKGWWNRRKAGS